MRARSKLAALTVAGLTSAALAATPAPDAVAYERCLNSFFEGQPEICFGGSHCNDRHPALASVYAIQDKYLGGDQWQCLQGV